MLLLYNAVAYGSYPLGTPKAVIRSFDRHNYYTWLYVPLFVGYTSF